MLLALYFPVAGPAMWPQFSFNLQTKGSSKESSKRKPGRAQDCGACLGLSPVLPSLQPRNSHPSECLLYYGHRDFNKNIFKVLLGCMKDFMLRRCWAGTLKSFKSISVVEMHTFRSLSCSVRKKAAKRCKGCDSSYLPPRKYVERDKGRSEPSSSLSYSVSLRNW